MKYFPLMPSLNHHIKRFTGVNIPRVRQVGSPLICKRLHTRKSCNDTRNIHFDQNGGFPFGAAAWVMKSVLAIMLVLMPTLLSAKPAVKPSEPLSISMDYQATESVLTYVVHIYLLSSLPQDTDVNVNIVSPDNARWLSGDSQWQGTLHPNELQTLTLTGHFSLADTNDIIATISTDESDDVQWSATATISLSNSSRSLSISQTSGTYHDQRHGQPIITFLLNP